MMTGTLRLTFLLLSAPAFGQGITPQVLVPGYTVERVSDGVDTTSITQMAFRPGDPAHLFAVRQPGVVMRYDYDGTTGQLSGAVVVASGLGSESLGLAFHGSDLYVSLNLGAGDGRLTRLSSPDAAGVYQARHDFVHSIPMGNHDVNQLQITGDTLYVGIGAVGRKGDPAEENIYTMTLARIGDLTQVDFSGPVGPDFKGPVNHLADPVAWVDTTASDGLLRYHASGFRNPFGIAVDEQGRVWASTNGNSDPGFLSPDYLYAAVPLGGQGLFPPPSFGFGPPHIVGTPIAPLSDLGQSPSPTGFAFVPAGRDRGLLVLAQAGATRQDLYPVGKDVLLVDPDDGTFQILVDDMNLPTDVVADPFGRMLISDFSDGLVWLLTPPPADPAGRVPSSSPPLTVERAGPDLTLGWGASCAVGDDDFAVYQGTIGAFSDPAPATCTTGGATTWTLPAPAGSVFFLVVPVNRGAEGSYGLDGGLVERPASPIACLPKSIQTTCP